MAREITIDRSGRLVIPKEVRRAHRLEAGTRLTLIEEGERLVLVPRHAEVTLVERDGLLVVTGAETLEIPDHRSLREDRLDRFSTAE
jgi:AbrB family looped-hinge helix DNA binding protein